MRQDGAQADSVHFGIFVRRVCHQTVEITVAMAGAKTFCDAITETHEKDGTGGPWPGESRTVDRRSCGPRALWAVEDEVAVPGAGEDEDQANGEKDRDNPAAEH